MGAGKSLFLEHLKRNLQDRRQKTVYFDAWKNDFHGNVMAAFIFEVARQIKSSNQLLESGAKMALDVSSHALSNIIKSKFDIDIKEIAKGNFDKADFDNNLKKEKSNFSVFKNELSQLAKEGHVVFLIGELDRCRPSHAVDVLEVIKHFFDIPNVTFIFAVNISELQKSIKHVYGDIDTAAYLRKFFDIRFNLPDLDHKEFVRMQLIKSPHFNQDKQEPYLDYMVSYVSELTLDCGLQGRVLERVMNLFIALDQLLNWKEPKNDTYIHLLASIAIAKTLEPENFSQVTESIKSRKSMKLLPTPAGSVINKLYKYLNIDFRLTLNRCLEDGVRFADLIYIDEEN